MDQPATALGRALNKTTYWGQCQICEVEFPNGIENHSIGKNHFSKLKGKLNWRLPNDAMEYQAFTQYWRMDGGSMPFFWFNHLSGQMAFCNSCPECVGGV